MLAVVGDERIREGRGPVANASHASVSAASTLQTKRSGLVDIVCVAAGKLRDRLLPSS